jgi:hypothetical protein
MKSEFTSDWEIAGSWGSGENSLDAAEEFMIGVYGSEATGSVSQ